MKQYAVPVVCVVAVVLLLAASAGLAAARNNSQGQNPAVRPAVLLEEDVRNYIPIQGRLTNSGGAPLSGEYEITFRLYDVETGGEALCQDTNTVEVANGLFTSAIYGDCANDIHGQQLFVSIQVESDAEMTPRQPIYAVPYAWSLRPNADIIGWVGPGAILDIENWDPAGRGLRSYAMAETGTNYGVVGAAKSPDGTGGYFYNTSTAGGVGLQGSSTGGVALRASGDGVIQSTAKSYVWISGNGVRPYNDDDPTDIDLLNNGGARILSGDAGGGNRNVMLPITVTGPMYGQAVTVTALDIFYRNASEFGGITAVLLRRQTGTCNTNCYVSIIDDHADYTCQSSINPSGCTIHWDLTENNVLTADSGILYLTLELPFYDNVNWTEIGGARLTLAHE